MSFIGNLTRKVRINHANETTHIPETITGQVVKGIGVYDVANTVMEVKNTHWLISALGAGANCGIGSILSLVYL
jgi:hypothetical protein